MKLFVFYNATTKELVTVVNENSLLATEWLKKCDLKGIEGFYLTTSSSLNQNSSSYTSIEAFDRMIENH